MLSAYERNTPGRSRACPPGSLVEWSPGDGYGPICAALGLPEPGRRSRGSTPPSSSSSDGSVSTAHLVTQSWVAEHQPFQRGADALRAPRPRSPTPAARRGPRSGSRPAQQLDEIIITRQLTPRSSSASGAQTRSTTNSRSRARHLRRRRHGLDHVDERLSGLPRAGLPLGEEARDQPRARRGRGAPGRPRTICAGQLGGGGSTRRAWPCP